MASAGLLHKFDGEDMLNIMWCPAAVGADEASILIYSALVGV